MYRHTRAVHSNLIGKRVVYKAHMHCHHQRKPLTSTQEARSKMSKDKRPLLKSVRQKKDILPQHTEVNCISSITEGSIEESKVSISSNYSDYYF